MVVRVSFVSRVKRYSGGFICAPFPSIFAQKEKKEGEGEGGHIPSFLANFYTQSRGTMKYSVAHARLTADLVKNRIFISIKFIRVAGSTSPSLPFFVLLPREEKVGSRTDRENKHFRGVESREGGKGERERYFAGRRSELFK